jgi:hypothetical protein
MTMTDRQHPITPPPELVQQWGHDANLLGVPHNDENWAYEQHIANRAAQWGADQELEACCDLLTHEWGNGHGDRLHRLRHPKPPSLKEQALDRCNDYIDPDGIIRRALEALPDG